MDRDDFYKTELLVLPDTTISVEWDPEHPLNITGTRMWGGSNAMSISLSYDVERNTTTCLVPEKCTGELFYHCHYHKVMGVREMMLLEATPRYDDMKSIKSQVLPRSMQGPVTRCFTRTPITVMIMITTVTITKNSREKWRKWISLTGSPCWPSASANHRQTG